MSTGLGGVRQFMRWIEETDIVIRASLTKLHEEIHSDIFKDTVEGTPRDTGTAQDSWEETPVGGGRSEIRSDLDYIVMLEYGRSGGRTPHKMATRAIQAAKRRYPYY